MKKMIPLALLLIIFSCISKNNISKDSANSLKIIKFMGVDMYSSGISKNVFWTYDEEHMFMYMKKGGFLSDIENYKKTEANSLKEYGYAFIKGNDTIYSDSDLKVWEITKNKKRTYYYDESGETANFLKRYPFFRDCPYTPDNE